MTDDMSPDELLAAEYALGLLEGEDLLMARGRLAREPEFATSVAFWERQLVPLLDELGGARPSPELLGRIMAETGDGQGTGEVIALQQKVRFWQRVAGGAAVAAVAALSIFVLTPQQITPPTAEAGPPLAASIPIADTPLRLGVTYLPGRDELLVSASGLSADGVHDHELWLVPPEGELQSLGVVVPGEERRIALEPGLAAMIASGSKMVLTREPIGGKPEGQDAGPVVAEGTFTAT